MSILQTAQRELNRHSWEHFVDNPPSIAQGGRGVVVPGCRACKKVINTSNGFVEHLVNDVLPGILEAAHQSRVMFNASSSDAVLGSSASWSERRCQPNPSQLMSSQYQPRWKK
jgi:hypothetical protein